MHDIQSQLEQCLEKFRAGNLTDQDLQAALEYAKDLYEFQPSNVETTAG